LILIEFERGNEVEIDRVLRFLAVGEGVGGSGAGGAEGAVEREKERHEVTRRIRERKERGVRGAGFEVEGKGTGSSLST